MIVLLAIRWSHLAYLIFKIKIETIKLDALESALGLVILLLFTFHLH